MFLGIWIWSIHLFVILNETELAGVNNSNLPKRWSYMWMVNGKHFYVDLLHFIYRYVYRSNIFHIECIWQFHRLWLVTYDCYWYDKDTIEKILFLWKMVLLEYLCFRCIECDVDISNFNFINSLCKSPQRIKVNKQNSFVFWVIVIHISYSNIIMYFWLLAIRLQFVARPSMTNVKQRMCVCV